MYGMWWVYAIRVRVKTKRMRITSKTSLSSICDLRFLEGAQWNEKTMNSFYSTEADRERKYKIHNRNILCKFQLFDVLKSLSRPWIMFIWMLAMIGLFSIPSTEFPISTRNYYIRLAFLRRLNTIDDWHFPKHFQSGNGCCVKQKRKRDDSSGREREKEREKSQLCNFSNMLA